MKKKILKQCDLDYCLDRMSAEQKYGDCETPSNRSEKHGQTLNCFDDCDGDYRCRASDKCCRVNCNRLCQSATNLDQIPTNVIPSIPTNVTVVSVELEQRRKAYVSWQMRSHHSHNELIDYIIEARAHVGSTFSKHKLSLSNWFAVDTEYVHMEQKHSQSFQ